jgi:hypothetical protein
VLFGLFCVAVECALNRLGALVWTWSFWRFPHVELVVLAYTLPFLALTWAHDRLSLRAKVRAMIAAFALALAAHVLFAVALGWV